MGPVRRIPGFTKLINIRYLARGDTSCPCNVYYRIYCLLDTIPALNYYCTHNPVLILTVIDIYRGTWTESTGLMTRHTLPHLMCVATHMKQRCGMIISRDNVMGPCDPLDKSGQWGQDLIPCQQTCGMYSLHVALSFQDIHRLHTCSCDIHDPHSAQ